MNEVDPVNESVSPGIRQTLMHWAFDVTTVHLDMFKQEKGEPIPDRSGDKKDVQGGSDALEGEDEDEEVSEQDQEQEAEI